VKFGGELEELNKDVENEMKEEGIRERENSHIYYAPYHCVT
jgi:hypothetical protein